MQADQQGQLDTRQLLQQLVEPQFGAFSPRRQIAAAAAPWKQ